MEKELLFRFLKCETTPSEEESLADWLEASSDHRRELDAMQLALEAMILRRPALDNLDNQAAYKQTQRFSFRKFARVSAAAAATILAAAGIGYGVSSQILGGWSQQQTVVEVPPCQRISVTLGDGTLVWLNSGSRLEYPSIFSKKQRRVKISGEAMFEVEYDPRRPFIVETFAGETEVLGTKFNIYADPCSSGFSVVLLEGRLKVSDRNPDNEPVILFPDEMANLVGGHLEVAAISNRDDFLWVDGLLNLDNLNFNEVLGKFERYYGYDIIIEMPEMPQIKYNGKLKISSGIDYALQLLQLTYDFSYVKNDRTNTIHIK